MTLSLQKLLQCMPLDSASATLPLNRSEDGGWNDTRCILCIQLILEVTKIPPTRAWGPNAFNMLPRHCPAHQHCLCTAHMVLLQEMLPFTATRGHPVCCVHQLSCRVSTAAATPIAAHSSAHNHSCCPCSDAQRLSPLATSYSSSLNHFSNYNAGHSSTCNFNHSKQLPLPLLMHHPNTRRRSLLQAE